MGLERASDYPHLVGIQGTFIRDGIEMVWFPEGASTRIARIRRGKWVYIPPKWRGISVSGSTIRKRPSKMIRKQRRRMTGRFPYNERYKGEHAAPSIEE